MDKNLAKQKIFLLAHFAPRRPAIPTTPTVLAQRLAGAGTKFALIKSCTDNNEWPVKEAAPYPHIRIFLLYKPSTRYDM